MTPSALASVAAALVNSTAAIHTVTGERFQPTRVTYDVRDAAR